MSGIAEVSPESRKYNVPPTAGLTWFYVPGNSRKSQEVTPELRLILGTHSARVEVMDEFDWGKDGCIYRGDGR